jgi:hypothetical protein
LSAPPQPATALSPLAAGGGGPEGDGEAVALAEVDSEAGCAVDEPDSSAHELTTIETATTTSTMGPRMVDPDDRNIGIGNR